MSFKTDKGRVLGLGSAKEGANHWWEQRITAVALVILIPLFVFMFGAHLGKSHDAVTAVYAHPAIALIAILTIIASFAHLKLGLQVVIEDYVHGKGARTVLMFLNTLGCWLLGLTGVFAVAKMAFGA